MEIEEYDPKKGIQDTQKNIRLSVDYDEAEAGLTMIALFDQLLSDSKVSMIQGLVLGAWEDCSENQIQIFLDRLVEKKASFPQLKALFVGEMDCEECEMSWINQGSYDQVVASFPDLEHLQIRGGTGLSLPVFSHGGLKKLIIETGGMDANILQNLVESKLPNLVHLELWLGTGEYGWTGQEADIFPFLNPETFPSLKYLGLCNSDITDGIAEMIASNDFILSQLDVLDLSGGTLTDVGAAALLKSSRLNDLDKLDLHHHYMSPKMEAKLKELKIEVEVSEREEDGGEVYRYVSVGE